MIVRATYAVSVVMLLISCNPGFIRQVPPTKSTLSDWEKFENSIEQRRIDLINCGGFASDNYGPSDDLIRAELRPGEVDKAAAWGRIDRRTEQCMLDKKYHYTGSCIGKSDFLYRPACVKR